MHLAPGDVDTARLQRCPQRVQHLRGELGCLVEEQHTPMGARDGARPGHPRPTADDAGHTGGVVRVGVRRPGDQALGEVEAGQRMDRGHLQRVGQVEVGQQPGQALRQHRLAHPGRPVEEHVVPARGGDLQGPLRLALPDHVGQVETAHLGVGPGDGTEFDRVDQRHRVAPQFGDELAQRGQAEHLDPLDQPRLRRLSEGHDHPREACPRRGQRRGQDAPDRSQAPVESELAQQHGPVQRLRPEHPGRRQHGRGDGQVVVATRLGQRGRTQIDRQERRRPGLPGVGHRRLAAVAGLIEGGVGQPDQHRTGQSAADVGLHLDNLPLQPDQGHRTRAGQHQPTARTWVICGA